MKLIEVVEKLNLEVKTGANRLDNRVRRGYASDLLSDVMANSEPGDIWITLQVHQNVVAVASLNDLSAIILVNGRKPEDETIEKAEKENMPIMVSELPAFELVGRLYELGIPGKNETQGWT